MIGKFKDETSSCPIREFLGLRPKMYRFIYKKDGKEKEKKTAKGVKKCVTERESVKSGMLITKTASSRKLFQSHSMMQIRSVKSSAANGDSH